MHTDDSEKRRKEAYKKVLDNETCRRRRGDATVEIRKQKREESLAKRRSVALGGAADNGQGMGPGTMGFGNDQGKCVPPSVDELPRLASEIQSGSDPRAQLEATRQFRKILSVERNPPVEAVLQQTGVLPLLIGFLGRVEFPELQLEAAWALTNIASTEFTKVIVENGAIPHLTRLLMSPNPDVREQCAWCLGNIAGDCAELRDAVLGCQALEPLLLNIRDPSSASMLRNTVWSLSNCCRGKPQPMLDAVAPAIPVLAQVISSCLDTEVLQDVGWAMSYLSDGDNQRIQAVVESGVIPDLVRLLGHSQTSVVTPALRTLGNIVSGSDGQTQAVLDAGALMFMPALLANSKKNVRKETCWLLSNIAAGNPNQISTLTHTKGLLQMVVAQLKAGEWDVKKEAAWVISNVATGGTRSHVQQLVDSGAIKPLCDLLTVDDAKIIEVALDALEAVLKTGHETGEPYLSMVEEAEGYDRLEHLQGHENELIYKKAVTIIERYLGVDDDDENAQPNTISGSSHQQEGGVFQFNAGPVVPEGGFSFQGFQ